jgi:hypothetical protein
MVQRRLVLAAAAAASLCGCSTPPARAAAGQLVDVQLIDRARQHALPEYRHRGATWVAGRPGERYAVRLTNRSGARVLVVLSVDGVNAISGQTAGTSQSGYVLSPWQSADITGWRKNDDEAAAFYFTALPDSYAARTGRPHNVGVIGAAVFRERVPPPPVSFEPVPYSRERDDGANRQESRGAGAAQAPALGREAEVASSRAHAPRADKLGTGHGEREHAPIERTAFERATSQPAEIVQLRYDSRANLVAAGIIGAPPAWRGGPDPFPGYVPDPP